MLDIFPGSATQLCSNRTQVSCFTKTIFLSIDATYSFGFHILTAYWKKIKIKLEQMTKSTEVIWGLECVPYASLPSKLYHQHILDSLT